MATNANKKETKPIRERFSKGFTDISGRDGFFRPHIDAKRWSYGWQILRDNFSMLVGVNLIMALFVAPIFVIVFLRQGHLAQAIAGAPFAANVGLGLFPNANLASLPQTVVFREDLLFYSFLPLAIIWLGVGISGGMFTVRNFCWGEKPNIIRVFLLGLKRHALSLLPFTVVYALVVSGGVLLSSYIDVVASENGNAWYFVLAKVADIVVMSYFTVWYMMYVSMGVNYDSGVFPLLKNSLKLTSVMLPLNVFFAVFSLAIFALLFFGMNTMIFGIMATAVIGVVFAMVVWSVYTQWLFDRAVTPAVRNKYVPTNAEIESRKRREEAAKKQAQAEDTFVTVGSGVMRDLGEIMPVSKGSVSMVRMEGNFTRADIERSDSTKKEMLSDVDQKEAESKEKTKKKGR